jgi:hypothetical protein
MGVLRAARGREGGILMATAEMRVHLVDATEVKAVIEAAFTVAHARADGRDPNPAIDRLEETLHALSETLWGPK